MYLPGQQLRTQLELADRSRMNFEKGSDIALREERS
jgi:hypothetical protein